MLGVLPLFPFQPLVHTLIVTPSFDLQVHVVVGVQQNIVSPELEPQIWNYKDLIQLERASVPDQ
jgi:hypothetical protein